MTLRKLVFVVDDQAALVDVLATVLERGGFEVATFTNPTDALAAAASLSPNVVLSDFSMPDMDGLTLALKLREAHPDCKVLMMSGSVHEAKGHPAYQKFEFLRKPLRMSDLLARVRAAVGEE